MKSNRPGVFNVWVIWEGRNNRDMFVQSTIQISRIIVERHPKKMGITMWINSGKASGTQERQRI